MRTSRCAWPRWPSRWRVCAAAVAPRSRSDQHGLAVHGRRQGGDAPPEFDDASWEAIRVDRIWEEQGHDPLDGSCWYRLRVTIPASLREKAFLKDGVRIFLGKINNFDQSFLNGQVFGVNGAVVTAGTPLDDAFTKAEMAIWNVERAYVLGPDDPRIRWGEENVIAVRVFDQGGQGGLWSGTGRCAW